MRTVLYPLTAPMLQEKKAVTEKLVGDEGANVMIEKAVVSLLG